MSRHTPPEALYFGPYAPPPLKIGDHVDDLYKGRQVTVAGWTDAPAPWPYWRGLGRTRLPVLVGDLARAVLHEPAVLVALWWGVSRATALRWRQALGVERFNEGTQQLWRELAATKLDDEARRRAVIAHRQRKRGPGRT